MVRKNALDTPPPEARLSAAPVTKADPLRLMLSTAAAIFCVEAGIMLLFLVLPEVSGLVEVLIDSTLLAGITVPILYVTWYRPLRRQIDENSRSNAEIQRRTFYDPLTRLPNRVYFHERLQHEIEIARRERSRFALLVLDLCRFHIINSTLGHRVGDGLLEQVAARLKGGLRESDTVARLSADVFGVVLRNVDLDTAGLTADKLQLLMQPSFRTDQAPIELEATCGIALYPDHADDGVQLLQRAELALTAAKDRKELHGIYRADNDGNTRRRLMMFGMLRAGLQRGELTLHYQPKIALTDGAFVGAEALVRWNSPDLGLVSPAEFIPLAEQTSLIKPLTAWVLREALRQVEIWQKEGTAVPVAINLSARNLSDETLPSQVTELLASSGVSANLLTMEVTESAVMANADRAMQILRQLHELGVTLSIDDFGTGYGSLTYLRTVPASELKIDRSFVLDIESNESTAAIVGAVINLGHGLGLKVVAEGVETLAALQRLRQLGCDLMQGYFVSRPLPAAEFSRFVAEYSSGPLAKQLRDDFAASHRAPETGVRIVGHSMPVGIQPIERSSK